MSGQVHIASFLVQHTEAATSALDQCLARLPGLELALRAGPKSVLLAEVGDSALLLDHLDMLRAVPGVHAVQLVHHHEESGASLDEEV